MHKYNVSVTFTLVIYMLLLFCTISMGAKLKGTPIANNNNQGTNDGATGSAHGPNWDYGWGWGSGSRSGWGWGYGSSHTPTGFARGFGYGFGSGSGSGSGSGYGYGSGSSGSGYGYGAGGDGFNGSPSKPGLKGSDKVSKP